MVCKAQYLEGWVTHNISNKNSHILISDRPTREIKVLQNIYLDVS